MDRRKHSSGLFPRLLAGLAVVLMAPALARAQSVQFRNDTPVPLVVQASSLVRGQLVRDRPHTVAANDKSPVIALPGNKIITIYEAKVPNRALFQSVIPASTEDLIFSIQVEGTRIKVEKYRPSARNAHGK